MLSKLRDIYGDQLVDIFEGTPLEQEGRKRGFGGYVVRGVIDKQSADQYHVSLDSDMQKMANARSLRAIQLRGGTVVVQHDTVHSGQLHMQIHIRWH